MRKSTYLLHLLILGILLLPPRLVTAQIGSLDYNFDNDGIATTDIGPPNTGDHGLAVAVQPDGKIILAGISLIGFVTTTGGMQYIERFALARFNSNGSLDNSFGVGGKVVTQFGWSTANLHALAIQTDGKIVVGGSAFNDSIFAIVRYTNDGILDSTFGNGGIVTTVIGASIYSCIYSVAIQPDGKIVAGGKSLGTGSQLLTLARYNSNGSADTTFDSDGIVTTNIGNIEDVANSIALQADGKILAGGYSSNGPSSNFTIVRYNSNGAIDTTFNSNGIVITQIGTKSVIKSIAVQSDGKIVAGGKCETSTITEIALARYSSNGNLDSTFGNFGIVTTSIGNHSDKGNAIIIQPDNKILLTGNSSFSSGINEALVRYNSNGNLDSTFDNDGIITTSFGPSNYSYGNSIALQTNGKIIVGGTDVNFSNPNFALARYNNDVSLGSNEFNYEAEQMFINPNPFSVETTLSFDVTFQNGTLIVYNVFGQQIKIIKNISGNTFTLFRDNLPNGLYFIWITQDNKIISRNKLVITD